MIPALCRNSNVDKQRALYPAMIIAAMSVTIFSLVGIAGITGHLPSASAKLDSASAPLSKQVEEHATACADDCGVVEAVRSVESDGRASGVGAVVGGVAGVILGNSLGDGDGRAAMTVIGGGAGAYAGNEIEKHSKRHITYQTRVRMDNGVVLTFSQRNAPDWVSGSKVQVVDGQLRPHPGS